MGGGHYFANAIIFIIDIFFGLYIFTVLLRFLFGLVRADFYNPISIALIKITNPLLLPLRRLIPGYGLIDWASLLLLMVLQFLQITLIGLVVGHSYQFFGTMIWSIANLLELTVNIFIFSIIIDAMMSWFNPGPSVLNNLLYRLNYPFLNPTRKRIPMISGIDISPFVVVIVLQLIVLLLIDPLQDLGKSLAGYYPFLR